MRERGKLTWVVCGLLLAATVLNYLDRQVLSLTAEKIIAEYHTDKAGFGELIAAFRFSYAAVQVFGGWIVDSLDPGSSFPPLWAFGRAPECSPAWRPHSARCGRAVSCLVWAKPSIGHAH